MSLSTVAIKFDTKKGKVKTLQLDHFLLTSRGMADE